MVFGYFLLLGKFSLLEMAKYWANLLAPGHTDPSSFSTKNVCLQWGLNLGHSNEKAFESAPLVDCARLVINPHFGMVNGCGAVCSEVASCRSQFESQLSIISFIILLTMTFKTCKWDRKKDRKHENKEKEAENDYLVNGYLVIFIKIFLNQSRYKRKKQTISSE